MLQDKFLGFFFFKYWVKLTIKTYEENERQGLSSPEKMLIWDLSDCWELK